MKGDLRCVEGRLYRHDPQHDDPELETDVGACPGCFVCQPEPECPYCGTTEGLRKAGEWPPDFICEDCFTPTDTGPCFDDLEPLRSDR